MLELVPSQVPGRLPQKHMKSNYNYVLKKKKLRWWKGGVFEHPAVLLSVFYAMENKIWNARETFDIPKKKGFYFVADSGGFQSYSKNSFTDPLSVTKWMEMNEVEIGMMLDIPPSHEAGITIDKEFEHKLEYSKRNYEIMADNRERNDWLMYKPIHGWKYEAMDKWYKETEEIPADGMAATPRVLGSSIKTAFILGFAIHKGIKNFHHFYTGPIKSTPVITYAGKYFDHLTFDSANYAIQGVKARSYNIPFYGKNVILGEKVKDNILTELPCFCPICSNTNMDETLTKLGGIFISLHNLWYYIQKVHVLKKLAEDRDLFRSCFKDQKILDAFNLIDAAAEGDFEKACLLQGLTMKRMKNTLMKYK